MSRVNDFERKHWRNKSKALAGREDPNNIGRNPWFVLIRWENSRGDVVSLGYAEESARIYALAFNGNVVELFQTKKAVREAATALMRKIQPGDLSDDEDGPDRNALAAYVAASGGEFDQSATAGELREQALELKEEAQGVYNIEEAQELLEAE